MRTILFFLFFLAQTSSMAQETAQAEGAKTAPSGTPPFPAGGTDEFSAGLNRGRFLKNGFLGFASVYAASKIPWQQAFEAAVAESEQIYGRENPTYAITSCDYADLLAQIVVRYCR